MKKVIARQLTSKGLLVTFEGGATMLLTNEKLQTLNLLGLKAPGIDQEVSVKPSVDAAGNASSQWVDMIF